MLFENGGRTTILHRLGVDLDIRVGDVIVPERWAFHQMQVKKEEVYVPIGLEREM